MKHKVGDKVRVKSKEWWDAQPKNESGDVDCGADTFIDFMTPMCGKIVEISDVFSDTYCIKDYGYNWTDEMFDDSYNDKKSTISGDLIKDIADVIKQHNLGVCVSENDGKLIIEPLKVEKDLPIDTIVVCSDKGYGIDNFHLRYYAGRYKTFNDGFNSKSPQKGIVGWRFIIEYSKFDPNNIEESLKYNIVDKTK